MSEFTTVANAMDIQVGELAGFDVAGVPIAVANVEGSFYAFGDVCTHMGCSLSEGDLEGPTVTCVCHGSQFEVTTGSVRRGPALDPVSSYPVRVTDGAIQVQA